MADNAQLLNHITERTERQGLSEIAESDEWTSGFNLWDSGCASLYPRVRISDKRMSDGVLITNYKFIRTRV